MIAGATIFTVGAVMLYTLSVSTSAAGWIGYQLIAGFGAGAGVQVPFIAVQVVLNSRDMPTGNALAIFFNSLGGAVSISVAQNIFSNDLTKYVPKYAPGVSVSTVVNAGSSNLRSAVTAEQLPGVLLAYCKALDQAYIIPIAFGSVAVICGCFVEWKSVKGKKLMAGGA